MKHRIVVLLALLACSYVFLFLNLGAYSLKEPDEGRYAEIPREMVERGDYVVPYLNYVRYFEKPPLLYWAVAASYSLFGIDEWSARFPNAVVAFFSVLTLYGFTFRRFGTRKALLSSFILLSSFGFFAMGRIVTTDMLFSFLLFAALVCFYQFYIEKKRLFVYLFYTALALSILAKGPVAILLIAGTILIFLFFEKRLSFLKALVSPVGFALFLAISVPWFVAMCIKEKQFFDFFFVDQHILRFLTTKHNRSGPVYYFLPVLFGGLFPWSFFIPRAVIRYWRRPELRLFFIWSALVFVFFSVSGSKLPPYILPIYPAVALILGFLFEEGWGNADRLVSERIFFGIFFALCAVLGFAFGSGIIDKYFAFLPDVAVLASSIRGLGTLVGFLSVAMLCVLFARTMRRYRALSFSLGLFSLGVIIGLISYSHVIDEVNTTKRLAAEIEKRSVGGSIVVNYRSFDETLPFYLARRTYMADYKGELRMGSEYQDAKRFFIDTADLRGLVVSRTPVFVVMKEKRLDLIGKLALEERGIIASQDKRLLIVNKAGYEMSHGAGFGGLGLQGRSGQIKGARHGR